MKKGSHLTDETKIKMSLAHKDKRLSHEHKANISASLKGNKNALGHVNKGFLGHHHTEESKAKIGAASRGKKRNKVYPSPFKGHHHTTEAKAKLSVANKGKPSTFKGHHHTPESKAKLSAISPDTKAKLIAANTGDKNPMFGKHHSEETKRKLSIACKGKNLGKHLSEESRHKWFLANQVKPNKQELKLRSILDRHFPNEWKFVGDGQLIIQGLCPDFVNIDSKKAVIELFGNYWHSKEAKRWNRTELGRIMAFNSLGFKCLVIWEQELKNEENIVSKVEQFMKRGKR